MVNETKLYLGFEIWEMLPKEMIDNETKKTVK